ncbi:phosphonate metabolism protein/1,5-bisphosphokinase (PRPP-forming) PhnN [Elioraea rosea]|uniref:phosphonate metabolism protein/1,5-bisphosphokinase (PRPP-forming) PhnN n=1 Tax=Elioraea rosea TaxID=2492390 RepID=UPI00118573AC|nr:phosphonate metabolism protein/1,5-bisphosphokinase (PRPP-forming) PhnN [Elioraea rosea]
MSEGLLALVFGPSGAGKDSVLDAAARMLPAGSRIVFARRAITRPEAAVGEAHEAITWPEFAARRAAGSFLLSWEANGHGYGIPAQYARMLDAGMIVVASVSRTVLGEAARLRWPVLPIRITAPAPILAERLARRGREDAAAIADRLARASLAEPALGLAVHEIVNDGTLEEAAARFLALVQRPNR